MSNGEQCKSRRKSPTPHHTKVVFFVIGGLVVLLAFWQIWSVIKVAKAKRFCEMIIPEIQKHRKHFGSYPKQAEPSWWLSKDVPKFIDPNSFFVSQNDDTFLLRFRDLTSWGDDVWGYHTNRWLKYDGY